MKPPKNPRLSDDRCQHLAKALPLLSPGVSSQWSPGVVHIVTDVKRVKNLAELFVVRGLKPSSRASVRGQRGVLETSTAAETVVRREGTKIAFHLEPDRFDLQFATKELAQDVQTPSMLSTLRLRRFAWYLVGGADVSPFLAHTDEPGTMLVWADVDWSGDAMTCKSTSDGSLQLENHGIEAWSVVQ